MLFSLLFGILCVKYTKFQHVDLFVCFFFYLLILLAFVHLFVFLCVLLSVHWICNSFFISLLGSVSGNFVCLFLQYTIPSVVRLFSRSVGRSVGCSVGRSGGRSLIRSVVLLVGRAVGSSVSRWVSLPFAQVIVRLVVLLGVRFFVR